MSFFNKRVLCLFWLVLLSLICLAGLSVSQVRAAPTLRVAVSPTPTPPVVTDLNSLTNLVALVEPDGTTLTKILVVQGGNPPYAWQVGSVPPYGWSYLYLVEKGGNPLRSGPFTFVSSSGDTAAGLLIGCKLYYVVAYKNAGQEFYAVTPVPLKGVKDCP